MPAPFATLVLPPHRGGGASARVLRILVILVAALGLAAVTSTMTAARADAHDALVSTSPADGSTVGTLPAKVTLTFEEPPLAIGTQVRVVGPTGEVQQGKPQLVGNTVNQAIPPGSPAGAYTVTWRVTSDDGHPISGTFRFTATQAGAAATATTATTTNTPTATASTTPSSPTSSPPTYSPPTLNPPTSSPSSAAPGSTHSATAAAQDSGSSPWPWVIGIVAAALVLGAALAIWRSARVR